VKYFKTLIIILALSIIGNCNLYANKKAFEIEDLYKLKTFSNFSINNGKDKLLLSVNSYKLEKGEKSSNIFILDLKSGEKKQLTFNKKSDFHPFFGNNGKTIYFLSTRKNGVQLWKMAVDGGEPQKITDFETGISHPILSPDENTLYFTSTVFPECGANCECNKKMAEKLNKGKTQGHLGKELLFRHWTSYRDWQYSHLFKMDLTSGKVQAITEGKSDYPTYGGTFELSPNGEEICVTVNFDKNAANSTNSDLLLINLKTGEKTNITKTNKAFDGNPKYSKDGKYIAFRMQKIPTYESDRFRLAIYDRKTKKIKVLTENLDNWVQSFEWDEHSQNIYFTVHEKGTTPVYKVNIQTNKIEKVLTHAFISKFLLTNNAIVYAHSSIGEPYEIWNYNLKANQKPKRLTFFNKKIEDTVDIRKGEQVWIKGANGQKIHCFIVKPHNFDPSKKYPLILNIHGGPQYQWADSFRGDWQIYPGKGYVVAFPNPHGSTGYGQEFTKAISCDYNGKVMKDIALVTDYLADLPYVDKDRIGAMGWSWGGYAMMFLEGNSDKYKALVAMMGIFDLNSMYLATEELWFTEWDNCGTPWENQNYYKAASPSSYVKNFKTPCLVITGERDYRVPYTQSIQFFTALQKMGVDSEIIIFSNDGHWPDTVKSMPVYYNAHLEWFHKYLGGGKAPYDTEKMLRNLQFDNENKK
jgi:dipeptidyl aminopeptidase/acylaminoacyl peptidase